ncbi:MAG: ribosome biogenesis GTPase YlqF [Anaerovoracaceae bacterium]|nr:ribosome biogenesis GTPase YlqF [Anaerovoracaceae bacterium]
MIENINWYPGHMKKTRELITEYLKTVDAVVEVIDARIPRSSRNPVIDEITAGKPRIIALNKSDISDESENQAWAALLSGQGTPAVPTNCVSGGGVRGVLKELQKIESAKREEKGGAKPLRFMTVGVPNVGKSSFINRLTGRKSAQVGNRPGVTKGKQWLTMKNGMQILDTPGILWPKFEDQEVGLHLAFCGAIKDEIMDIGDLAFELLKVLTAEYPDMLAGRYKLDDVSGDALAVMESIAEKRGFIMSGGVCDYERTARTVLDEFRKGMIGRITLEKAGGE